MARSSQKSQIFLSRMKPKLVILFSVCILLLLSIPHVTFSWVGTCVAVHDGDTISVLHGGKAEIVRLYGIDCPEWRQPFYKWAKKFTSDLVCGKMVEVKTIYYDHPGRAVALVYIDKACLNKELLRVGLAWYDNHYCPAEELKKLEAEARAKRLGLWSKTQPVPPWKWRRLQAENVALKKEIDPLEKKIETLKTEIIQQNKRIEMTTERNALKRLKKIYVAGLESLFVALIMGYLLKRPKRTRLH